MHTKLQARFTRTHTHDPYVPRPIACPQAARWLEASAELFREMLDAEDSQDSAQLLAAIWQRSFVDAGESAIVKHLVAVLQVGRCQAGLRKGLDNLGRGLQGGSEAWGQARRGLLRLVAWGA